MDLDCKVEAAFCHYGALIEVGPQPVEVHERIDLVRVSVGAGLSIVVEVALLRHQACLNLNEWKSIWFSAWTYFRQIL